MIWIEWTKALFRRKPPNTRILLLTFSGFLSASVSATFLDARLTSHYYWGGPRSYPFGYYIAVVSFLFPVATYAAMVTAKGKAQETCAAWLPSLFLAIPFLWYFRPEFPHIGFCLDICGYVVLAFLTAILETAARPPDNGTLETDARIRRLEESIKDWRGILFLSAGSYLVWAIYWLQTLWIVAGLTVEANADKWLLGSVTAIKVVIFSLWVMMGPIAAIFNGLKAHQDRLVALSD